MLSDFSIERANQIIYDIQHLPNSKQRDRIELFARMEKLAKYIKKNENPEKNKKLCQAIIEILGQIKTPELEKIAQYVANKSKLGADKPFFDLFKTLVQRNHGNLASLVRINSAMHNYLAIDRKKLTEKIGAIPEPNVEKDFPNVPNAVLRYMTSFLDEKSAGELALTSKRHWNNAKFKQKKIKDEHLEALNEGQDPKQFKLNCLHDLFMYFGSERCEQLTKLKVREFALNNRDLYLLKNFKNTRYFILGNRQNINPIKILDAMPCLTHLNLYKCTFENQKLMKREKTYPNLKDLNLSECENSSELIDKNLFPNLEIIELNFCNLISKEVDNLNHFNQLKSLAIFGCTYNNKFPSEGTNPFERADCLKNSTIETLKLSNFWELKTLPSIPNVKDLDLFHCKNIDFSLLSKNFPFVEILDLRDSNFTNVNDLINCKNIRQLYLLDCKIKNWGELNKLSNLKHLSIPLTNPKEFQYLKGLSQCHKLKYLTLKGNDIKNLKDFPKCPAVKNLYLQGCESLEDISNLREIFSNLKSCYLPLPFNLKIPLRQIKELKSKYEIKFI